MRQARRLPSGVTDSWRMLRSELRGATESGICAEGAWKVCGKRGEGAELARAYPVAAAVSTSLSFCPT